MSKGRRLLREDAALVAMRFFEAIDRELYSKSEIAGSIRRQSVTVGDVDIVIALAGDEQARALNSRLGELFGWCKTPRLRGRARRHGEFEGVQIQVMDVSPESYGSALLMATGSAKFNVMMRGKAKSQGLLLNQYGLWLRDTGAEGWMPKKFAGSDEEAIFTELSIPYREPPARSL